MRSSISIQNAADVMDVCTDTIRKLLNRDELSGHYVGRSVRVYEDSISDYQDGHPFKPKTTKTEEKKKRHRHHNDNVTKAKNELRKLGML